MLDLSVKAAAERATLGEISSALEDKFGRYIPKHKIVQGAYRTVATEGAGEKSKAEYEKAT